MTTVGSSQITSKLDATMLLSIGSCPLRGNFRLSAIISAETGISSPQELLAMYGDKDGSITFEELKEVVKKANNLT